MGAEEYEGRSGCAIAQAYVFNFFSRVVSILIFSLSLMFLLLVLLGLTPVFLESKYPWSLHSF